ncbi:hypothetical protein CAter10_4828 [Collimonas arenae]|nr:hypothetical protein CAter10_4828 [Collimonas arenae]
MAAAIGDGIPPRTAALCFGPTRVTRSTAADDAYKFLDGKL